MYWVYNASTKNGCDCPCDLCNNVGRAADYIHTTANLLPYRGKNVEK